MPCTLEETVAIVGAGPVGLAAAAHALERGLDALVLEAGERSAMPSISGGMCACSRRGNTTSTGGCAPASAAGWNSPDPQHYPTGAELVERYLEPLAARTRAEGPLRILRAGSRRSAASDSTRSRRKAANKRPFELAIRMAQDQRPSRPARLSTHPARGRRPIPPGANGLAAIGEAGVHRRIAYAMPDVLGARAPAMPGEQSRCWAPAIPLSAR